MRRRTGGTSAEAALETFLRLRPRTITIALGSRRQPGLNTSRLLVSGELIMVDGEDLRFRSWEVEQLFRSVYDAPLTPDGTQAAARLAEVLPEGLDRVFWTNSGSESADTALKIALAYHKARGEGGRVRLIGRERRWSGSRRVRRGFAIRAHPRSTCPCERRACSRWYDR